MIIMSATVALADCIFVRDRSQDLPIEIPAQATLAMTQALRNYGYPAVSALELGYWPVNQTHLGQMQFTHVLEFAIEQFERLVNGWRANIAIGITRIEQSASGELMLGQTWQSSGVIERVKPLSVWLDELAQQAVSALPKPAQPEGNHYCWKGSIFADAKSDYDQDGIADQHDRCPDVPEDLNGYRDDDGCPENIPLVEMRIRSSETNESLDATIAILGTGKVMRSEQGDFLIPLDRGSHRLRISAKGYKSRLLRINVPMERSLLINLDTDDAKDKTPSERRPSIPQPSQAKIAVSQLDNRQQLREAVERACNQSEDRACLNALDAYLANYPDAVMTERRARVRESVAAAIDELYNLGLKALRQEYIEQAIEYWGDALELDSNNNKVREAYNKALKLRQTLGGN